MAMSPRFCRPYGVAVEQERLAGGRPPEPPWDVGVRGGKTLERLFRTRLHPPAGGSGPGPAHPDPSGPRLQPEGRVAGGLAGDLCSARPASAEVEEAARQPTVATHVLRDDDGPFLAGHLRGAQPP